MGNCQAVDVAASLLVIQHPNGKIERMYWPMSVSEVMKMNPGHYVSLIIPLPPAAESTAAADKTISSSVLQQPASSGDNEKEGKYKKNKPTIQFTRVKLLRPTDTLVLGRAYRLVTSQEVVKVLREKKQAKMNKNLIDIQDQDSALVNSNGILTASTSSSSSSSSSSSPSSERETSTSHDTHKGTPRLESQNRSRRRILLLHYKSSGQEQQKKKTINHHQQQLCGHQSHGGLHYRASRRPPAEPPPLNTRFQPNYQSRLEQRWCTHRMLSTLYHASLIFQGGRIHTDDPKPWMALSFILIKDCEPKMAERKKEIKNYAGRIHPNLDSVNNEIRTESLL